VLQYVAVYCSVLQSVARLTCGVLQYVAVYCSVLQCVAECCKTDSQFWIACMFIRRLENIPKRSIVLDATTHCNPLQSAATHCNTPAIYCNTLQHNVLRYRRERHLHGYICKFLGCSLLKILGLFCRISSLL